MRSSRNTPFQLTTLSGPLDGLTIALHRWPVTIGRDATNTVALRLDLWASRQHARLHYEDGQVWLEDLGGHNGTLMDGEPVRGRMPLAPGSMFRVGKTLLRLEAFQQKPGEGETSPLGAGNPLDSSQFSPAARQVITSALGESVRLHHYYLGLEHLFIAAIQPGQVAAALLSDFGLEPDRVQADLRVEVGLGCLRHPWQGVILTPRADRLLAKLAGQRHAAEARKTPVSEAELVEAILADADAVPTRWLRQQGCDPAALCILLHEASNICHQPAGVDRAQAISQTTTLSLTEPAPQFR